MKHLFRFILSALILLSSVIGCRNEGKSSVPEATVTRGTFYIDIYEEGEIEAINSITLSSPNIPWRFGNLKISYIVEDGAEVQAGDTVIAFDPSEVRKAIIDSEDRLIVSKAELEKMIAQHELDLEGLKADYEVTRISHEISRMELEAASHESDIKKKEIRLNLEKADISLKRAKEQIDNQEKIQAEERKQKQLDIVRDEKRLEEAYETLNKLSVVAPSPGIAILSHNWSTENKFAVGDQCWSGQQLIQLPDLSRLKAKVNINEVDISLVSRGQRVEVKPDAFSDSVFSAHIDRVANLAVNKDRKSKIKVFPVDVYIDRSHKNLLPGLTVSCRILIEEIADAISVPLDAVFKEGDKNYVFLSTLGGYKKTSVEVGRSNTDHIIILSGVEEGDKVALTDPTLVEEENDQKESK